MSSHKRIVIAGMKSIPWLVALTLYVAAQLSLPRVLPGNLSPELLVTLPRSVQVLLSAGDRYLAANLAGFRVLVADTLRMNAADFAVQAKLQTDIAWLNPAHEDNYYIAAALLPWNSQLEASQFVLRRASEARLRDYQPLFYYAFNYYHFLRDPATAAGLLLKGVERTDDQQDQWALQNLAARWIERGYQTSAAAGIVDAMAKNAPPGAFKNYLAKRALRLDELARLQELAKRYRELTGHSLSDLQQLVDSGLITEFPIDPLGVGFTLSKEGEPVFRR